FVHGEVDRGGAVRRLEAAPEPVGAAVRGEDHLERREADGAAAARLGDATVREDDRARASRESHLEGACPLREGEGAQDEARDADSSHTSAFWPRPTRSREPGRSMARRSPATSTTKVSKDSSAAGGQATERPASERTSALPQRAQLSRWASFSAKQLRQRAAV